MNEAVAANANSSENEESEEDEVDKRNAELLKKARGPVYSLEARRERAAKARYSFSPAKEINRQRGYFEAIVATAADDSKKSANEGDAAGSGTAVNEESSSSDDEAGSDEDETEAISLVDGPTKKYKVALLVEFAR